MRINDCLSRKMANMALCCACLIVTLHVGYEGGGISSWVFAGRGIGNIAVPYFFIASGFFLAGHMYGEWRNWWIHENIKRVFSLVIPYLFWNVFYWAFMKGLSIFAIKFGVVFGENCSCGLSLGLNPFKLPQLPYLWFVRCLIVFVVVLPVFLVLKRKLAGAVGILCLFVLVLVVPAWLPKAADWHEDFAKIAWLRGLLWFSLGVFLRWNPVRISVLNRCDGWIGGLIALGFAIIPWAILAMIPDLPLILYELIKNVIIAISLFAGWTVMPDVQLSKKITNCSFPIFLLHYAVLTMLVGVYRLCGIKEFAKGSQMMYFVTVSLTIGISLLLTFRIKKVGWLTKIAFGGR